MSRAEEGPLAGIRVIEVASWMFVPSAGTVLVDWGADVIKVEPITGDPQRGLITSGLVPGGAGGVNFMIEQPNRGKRSVAIDLSQPDGHEAFMKLVETADVVHWLARHGVEARAEPTVRDGSHGEVLLELAHEKRAELIVAGAYGHSRLGEWVFGGVTDTLLHQDQVFAFLSH